MSPGKMTGGKKIDNASFQVDIHESENELKWYILACVIYNANTAQKMKAFRSVLRFGHIY